MRYLPVPQWSSFHYEITSRPNSFHINLSMTLWLYDFMLASFVPVFAGGDHMVTCHISETTLYTAKKFHTCSSHLLTSFWQCIWSFIKTEHFLNFWSKWVNNKCEWYEGGVLKKSLDLPWVKSLEASGNTGDYPTSKQWTLNIPWTWFWR